MALETSGLYLAAGVLVTAVAAILAVVLANKRPSMKWVAVGLVVVMAAAAFLPPAKSSSVIELSGGVRGSAEIPVRVDAGVSPKVVGGEGRVDRSAPQALLVLVCPNGCNFTFGGRELGSASADLEAISGVNVTVDGDLQILRVVSNCSTGPLLFAFQNGCKPCVEHHLSATTPKRESTALKFGKIKVCDL